MDKIFESIATGSILLEPKASSNSSNNNDGGLAKPKDEELYARVKVRREFIWTEGHKVHGLAVSHDVTVVPDWFDPNAFQRAQDLFDANSAIIRVSEFMALLVVYHDFEANAPLLATGNSQTISKLYIRYLSTMVHLENWFRFDPFDPNSKAYKSLKVVRGYHRQVADQMNRDPLKRCPNMSGPDDVWINQYAMCFAQFTFSGFMAIFKEELGFSHFSAQDMHSMFHFWRVIGHCLGIEDRFNLCSGSDEETREFCRQIYVEQWLPGIKTTKEVTGTRMSKGIALAMSYVVPMINYNAFLHYLAPAMELDPRAYPLETLKDQSDYLAFRAVMAWNGLGPVARLVGTQLAEVTMQSSETMRRLIQGKLVRKFEEDPQLRYDTDEVRCPLVRFNYKTAFELDLN